MNIFNSFLILLSLGLGTTVNADLTVDESIIAETEFTRKLYEALGIVFHRLYCTQVYYIRHDIDQKDYSWAKPQYPPQLSRNELLFSQELENIIHDNTEKSPKCLIADFEQTIIQTGFVLPSTLSYKFFHI